MTSTIGGYIRMSAQMVDECATRPRDQIHLDLEWQPDGSYRLVTREHNPWHGPPVPPSLAIRRRLGGHPVGAYRKAAT